MDDTRGLVAYTAVAAFVYVTAWAARTDITSPRGLTLRLPFMLGALLMCIATVSLAICERTTQAAVSGMLGAGAFFLSLILHHQSTRIVVLAGAYTLALLVARGYGGFVSELTTVFAFLWAVFLTCFLSSQKPVVALFGGGHSTTLYSVVLCGVLALIYRLDLAPPVWIGRAVLLGIPATVMSTSHPDYLADKPSRLHRGITLLCILALMAFWLMNRSQPVFGLVMVLGPAITTVTAWYTSWRPAVLGPFYSFERRAAVLSVRWAAHDDLLLYGIAACHRCWALECSVTCFLVRPERSCFPHSFPLCRSSAWRCWPSTLRRESGALAQWMRPLQASAAPALAKPLRQLLPL